MQFSQNRKRANEAHFIKDFKYVEFTEKNVELNGNDLRASAEKTRRPQLI